MIRVLIFILCVVAAALGLAWLADRPGTITVSIGAPIDATGMKTDELNKRVEEWIEAEMPRLRIL